MVTNKTINRTTPTYLLMLGLLGLGGCSSFSDTGGFDRVESISKKELGSFELNTKGELTPAMQQTIQNLLKSPLTIDSSVQIALLNSKSLQSQYANLGIAEADLVQAGRLRNPGFSIGKTTQGGEREYENFVLFDLLGLLTLNQRTAIAERQFERAKIAAARDTLQLANKVRQAWIQAVVSQASARYYDQVISATEAGALLAKRMAEAGNISTLSYARQHSLYAEFSAQGQRSKQKATYYKEQLIRLIGLIDPNQVILPERLPNLPENTRPQQNSIQTAINQRLDLIMAREETEALAKSMGLTRATNWVNVLEVGYLNSTSNEAPTKEGYEIELRLPIFDWGDAKTAKAEQLYRQAMNRTADLAIKATSEVRERHDAYLNNYRIARHYRDEIVPIRQRINEENMLRYNGMLISVFEILADARSQIISVDAYLNALRDFWLSDINLTASLQGTSIFNSSVQMTTNITPDTSAGGGH